MNLGKILVVDDIEAVREIIIFYLRSIAQFEFLEASSGLGALELIKNHKEINLIISDHNMANGTGIDLYQMIRNNHTIPFIIHTTNPRNDFQKFLKDNMFHFLEKPTEIEQLKKLVLSLMLSQNCFSQLKQEEKYLPVQVSLVQKIGETKVPLYIRISETKFIKIHNEGPLEKDFLLDTGRRNQIHTLYIQQCDFQRYITEYQQKVQHTLDHPKFKIKFAIQHLITTAELVHAVQKQLGISEELKSLVEKNIEIVCRLSIQFPASRRIADEIQSSDSSPNTKHIILTSLIASAIGKHLNWLNDKTSEKFVFASILHDCTLDKTLQHFEFQSEQHSNTPEFKLHPIHAAEIAKNWKSCPNDVIKIIEQHHELPYGTGFPKGLDHRRITALSAVFIVSHDLAVEIILREKSVSVSDWINKRRSLYSSGDFKKALDAIQEMHLSHCYAHAG